MSSKTHLLRDVTLRYQAQALSLVFSDIEDLSQRVIGASAQIDEAIEPIDELVAALNRLPREIIVKLSAFHDEFGLDKQIQSLIDACNRATNLLDTSGGIQEQLINKRVLIALLNHLKRNQDLSVGNAAITSDFVKLAIETKALSAATTALVKQNTALANVLDRSLWQLFRAWLARRFTQ